jgi:hypothetical protein
MRRNCAKALHGLARDATVLLRCDDGECAAAGASHFGFDGFKRENLFVFVRFDQFQHFLLNFFGRFAPKVF